jgi:PAS domain S-box-containing protein
MRIIVWLEHGDNEMRLRVRQAGTLALVVVTGFGLSVAMTAHSAVLSGIAGGASLVLLAAAWWIYRTHKELDQQIVWLRGTLDAVPQPVTVTDLDMKWIFVNKVVEGLLGKKSAEIKGRLCSEWGAAICNTDKCGVRSLRGGRPQTEYMQAMPDGTSRAMTVDTSYIHDENGRRIGHVEIVTDSHSKYELEAMYSRIASSLEEISSTMTEMDAQVKESAGHAAAANQKAAEARSAIKDGGEKVQGLTDAMRQIGAASKRILGINKTVDEIAFQTNLLALNAAVEAARAGEAGAGFAVVADEVRSLARKASAAAQETSELITAAASDIQKGTNLADDAAAALETIGSSAGSLDKLVGLIAQASDQQSTGISAVSQAILELEKSALTQAHQTMAKDLVQIR